MKRLNTDTHCGSVILYFALYICFILLSACGSGSGTPDNTSSDAASPTATTAQATLVTSSSATLNGAVNPNGASTSYYFQWGTSINYTWSSGEMNAGSGTSAQSVSVPITVLNPDTAYHYRIVATNSEGTSYGDDQTFTTASVSVDTTPPQITSETPAPDSASVDLDVTVQATFNEPMDPNSLGNTVFTLSSAQGAVDAAVACSADALSVTLTPGNSLEPTTLYTATISTNARDANGNALAEPYSWQFTTRSLQHTLTVNKRGSGTGTVTGTPAGIDCGTTCQADFNEGTTITLAASADNSSEFNGWSGNCTVNQDGSCSLTITRNTTVDANFALRTYTISVLVDLENGLGGSISPTSATVVHGDNRTFNIQVDPYYDFSELFVDGTRVATELSYTFENVTADHTIHAIIRKNAVNISTNPEAEDIASQINASGHVVWTGSYDSDIALDRYDMGQIYCYYNDGSNPVDISNNWDSNDYSPQINASGHVVWGGSMGIYYYDGSSVVNVDSNGIYPQINASGHVVWEGSYGSNWEIYYFDGSNAVNISNNPDSADYSPQINASGHVVWDGYNYNDSDREIYYYDGSNAVNISNNPDSADYSPQINASGHVVWIGSYGLDREIYYYDGSNAVNISTNPDGDHYDPQINDDGHVVWHGHDGSSYEIYYYDGSNAVNISTNPDSDDYFPQINASGHVVWYSRNGSDVEIYYYDGSNAVNISNNPDGDDYDPQINDDGQVVWHGHDGLSYEIYLSVP